MSKHKFSGAAGQAIMLVGVAFVVFGSMGLLIATLIVDQTPPTMTLANPTGTQASPTAWEYNSSQIVKVHYYDAGGIASGYPTGSIRYPSGYTTDLALVYDGVYYYYYAILASYTGTYAVTFIGRDPAGNTTTVVGYALVASQPTGTWYWDGVATSLGADLGITNTTSHTVKFVLSGGSTPTSVYVVLKKGSTIYRTTTMTQSPIGTWTATVVLDQGDGTYTIEGHTVWSGGDVVGLSVIASSNEIDEGLVDGGLNTAPIFFGSMLTGFGLIIAGGCVSVVKKKGVK